MDLPGSVTLCALCAGLSCCAVLCFPTECAQRVVFRWLLFIDQLIAVMQLLHVKGLPTVHDISLFTGAQEVQCFVGGGGP
jgi:hypothetical protein